MVGNLTLRQSWKANYGSAHRSESWVHKLYYEYKFGNQKLDQATYSSLIEPTPSNSAKKYVAVQEINC